MSGLEFELTFVAEELKKLDLPVEIRKPNMVLVQRARASQRVELEPGTYYVGIKMPAGQEAWSQVTVPDEGFERVKLGPEPAKEPASQAEELQQYFTPSYVIPPEQRLSYVVICAIAVAGGLITAAIAYGVTESVLTGSVIVIAGTFLAGAAFAVALSTKVLRPGYTALNRYRHDIRLRQFQGNVLTGEYKLEKDSSLFDEQIPLSDDLVEIDFQGKNQGQIIQLLQTGEPPLNVILPAWQERGCRIVLKKQPDAKYSLEVHLKHPEAELLLRYWEQGRWQLAANVSDSAAVSAQRLLYDKLQHPISAAIGGYALLRLGALDRMNEWSENLMNWFSWLPDGAAVRGEHLARLGNHQEALEAFCQLRERGLPYLSDGLSYAVDRLRLYQSVGKKNFSEDDLKKCAATLALLEPFSYFTDFRKPLTTFTGLDPAKPDAKPLGAQPESYGGVKVTTNQPRIFEKPVAWLLGKQLLGGIKGMLLYTAYGAKLDPRDWMTPTIQDFSNAETEGKSEFWFDYMSDVGDGTKAMYGTAYLALTDLWSGLDASSTQLPSDRDVSTSQDGRTFLLPRGEFLFIGGDTAYHASDYLSLVNRIQRPFNYAYEDLKSQNLISDDEPRRPIFGIPGNHDYYDQIDGFRRQFRKPTRQEGPLPPKRSGGAFAQLTVAGFKRVQEASYIAVRLPFKWWLWGLDTESVSDRRDQHLDRRQEMFFKSLSRDGDGDKFKAPDKLILATSAPSTVFGKIGAADEQKASKPLKAIGLSRPFLPANGDLETTGDAELKTGQCRLDISGDVHHYARYWGPQSDSAPRKHSTAPRPSANSYASVVSGAGGAFHHPSTTYDNEICEQVLYPPENDSREVVADRLFKFWNVLNGGYVWLAGLIIAFMIYFGVTVPKSSREFISNFGILNTLQLTKWERLSPTILQLNNASTCAPVQPYSLWTTLGVVSGEWRPAANCTAANPGYFFPEISTWPTDLIIGQVFIWVSLAATLTLLGISLFSKWIFDETASPFEKKSPNSKLVPSVAVIALLTIVGLLTVQPYRDHITPFVSSLIVLYSIIVAITAIVLNVRYSEYVFRKSFVPATDTGVMATVSSFIDDYFPWALWLLAIIAVSFGLWFFGKNNLPAYLISDIVFIIVLVGATVGILLLSFLVSGALSRQNKIVRVVGKLLIGVWHLLLQLLVPFILVKLGSWLDWGLAAILLVLPIPLARYLLAKDSRVGLSLLWIVYGAVMLTLPYITRMFLPLPPVFTGISGWTGLVPALFAAGFGAILCCLWTGWYFAICFAFNGHNNEVGGAARIEEFKEFIRFRLTPEGLTGYVIALDNVSIIGEPDKTGRIMDGRDLKPKLIDVFHLTPKQ